MNQFFFVGQVVDQPVLEENERGVTCCRLYLEVSRPFANSAGEFETDLFEIEVWKGAAQTLLLYARKGAWLAIRGRMYTHPEAWNGKHQIRYGFIAENIEYIRNLGPD